MKIKKKLFVTMVISISILWGVLASKNYAVNEINEVDNTTTQTSTNTESNNNTTTQTSSNTESKKANQTVTKSSNANLSDLGITPYDFTGFKYGTTSYEVVVPEDTETVEVYAKTQDSKAKVTGTGKKNLEKGENKVEVVVTAENGTKKTYTINIIREVQQEEEETNIEENKIDEEGKGLAELRISNLTLTPEFKTDVYEYTVQYIGEDTKLNIETKPTSEDYVIEIVGNENIQEGENTITILVAEKNGENIATYQITVNKSLIDEEAIAREEAEKREQQQKIIIGAIVIVAILAIIVFIIIRHRRNQNFAEEFSGAYYYDKDDNDNHEEEYEEEEIKTMPKEELKQEFLNNYATSNFDTDLDDGDQESKKKGRYKGKRFK